MDSTYCSMILERNTRNRRGNTILRKSVWNGRNVFLKAQIFVNDDSNILVYFVGMIIKNDDREIQLKRFWHNSVICKETNTTVVRKKPADKICLFLF